MHPVHHETGELPEPKPTTSIRITQSSGRRSRIATGISFQEFPVTEIRHEWLKKISRQAEGPGKQPWVPSDCSKVCSLYFKLEDYRGGLKMRKLKPDAIPSIFPSYPVYLQEPPKKGARSCEEECCARAVGKQASYRGKEK
ncbi:hypothetical protein HPB49_005664 [Dermacentor silvarum]|uniref:Uncharacterized protein n=1 Tax=Dermacentor silvarum TaxID=543639 RepID=A0ACB8CQ72_DERSI|nr:hypothetical protein HPB49_005664 [Dermacentor silvarum]